MKKTISIYILIVISFTLFTSEIETLNDGPYVFISETGFEVHTVINDKPKKEYKELPVSFMVQPYGFKVNITEEECLPEPYEYTDVEEMLILSDIHGQFPSFVKLLKNGNVIDDRYNWIFGRGHLVIVGDVFDRGDTETECLWLIYKLEQEAKETGGKVHLTPGNHEVMIMQNDLRYVNKKYEKTAEMMGFELEKRYADNSVLGKWLRSKNTLIRINDMLFCHAGLSPEIIDSGLTTDEINTLIRNNFDTDRQEIKADETLSLLFKSKGPIWYRGYFADDSLTVDVVNNFTDKNGYKKIIVGHTTQDSILSLNSDKIIAVDSGIKDGDKGQALHWIEGIFYVIDIDNKRKILN
jgi:hypothetical protein